MVVLTKLSPHKSPLIIF